MATKAEVKQLGRSKAEREIKVITLQNGVAKAELWSFGARLHKLTVPHNKRTREIVKAPSDPVGKKSFAGASVGRVANIIQHAHFDFEGRRYHLEDNFHGDHIHGGTRGFHAQNWELAEVRPEEAMARFYLKLKQADDGYPGTIEVTLTYRLRENGLYTEFRAQSSHDTLFSPTLHPFFNLADSRNVKDHVLSIPYEYFQKLENGIPKGRPTLVKGWNDLTGGVKIDKLLTGPRKDILNLCWIRDGLPSLKLACKLSAENSPELSIYSSMPALQVYTGNTLRDDGLRAYSSLALEPCYPPDSANRVMKNRIILYAGVARMERIVYRWE